jgi:creatinine deaminase
MYELFWAIVGFVLGIPAGFISILWYERYKIGNDRKALMGLQGLWFEEFEDSNRQGYALGAFSWDTHQNVWRYDGTRFTADGEGLYHWTSQSLVPDFDLCLITYTYENTPLDAARPNETGLGHIEYGALPGSAEIEFTRGVFSDPTRSGHIYLKMNRLSRVFPHLQEQLDPSSRVRLGKTIAKELAQTSGRRTPLIGAQDAEFLDAAIAEAEAGLREGGIPIGAVLVYEGHIIGRGHNRRVQNGNPILHGEMDALASAGRQKSLVYTRSVLYTTLSPCAMCSGAILLYQIPRVVVGENINFPGEEMMLRSRGVVVDVAGNERCIQMMSQFKHKYPDKWKEDIGI